MILNIILIAVIILQSIFHYIERRDMMNRFMSKSFAEYKTIDNNPPNNIPSAHSKVLNRWRNTKAGE